MAQLTVAAWLWGALIFGAPELASASTAKAGVMHVLIDPGHGGVDRGAVVKNLVESQICLKIAQQLAAELKQDPRFKVSLTRSSDDYISLQNRSDLANQKKADIFLSIHGNSSPDPRAFGLEIYFQNQLDPDEESQFLANVENESAATAQNKTSAEFTENSATPENKAKVDLVKGDLALILEDLKRNYKIHASFDLSQKILAEIPRSSLSKIKAHAIRQAPFQVVSQVNIPSVLVEVGFLTHESEGPKLATGEYQTELAHHLYEGLVKYKEVLDKELP